MNLTSSGKFASMLAIMAATSIFAKDGKWDEQPTMFL